VIQREIQEALRKNLLDEDPRYLKASPLGMQYLNELQMLFLK
jgi:oxygen-independent coproporphyrinogen-3 oxidase